jgi:hypothetical protein
MVVCLSVGVVVVGVVGLVLDVERVVDGVDLLELDDVQLVVVEVKRVGHGGLPFGGDW